MAKKEEKFGGFVKPLTKVIEKGGWSGKYVLDSLVLEKKVNEAKKLIEKEEESLKQELRYERKTTGLLTSRGIRINEYRMYTIFRMKEILKVFEGK